MLFFYNILFPLAFLFFLPGIIVKLVRRGGQKANFPERFAIFAKDKLRVLKGMENCVWVHSVSVGETMIALSLIKEWRASSPSRKFVLSTTTTTGQAVAAKGAPEDVAVIFCPLDFCWIVRRAVRILRPAALVILETEIWPNMICEIRKAGAPAILVNARISDRSAGGYRRFAFFFAPVLRKLSLICTQSQLDAERIKSIDPAIEPVVCGNMKFDTQPSAGMSTLNPRELFGSVPGLVILAASTHPGEEKLVLDVFARLKDTHPAIKLVIIPRHAERGSQIESEIIASGISCSRRSTKTMPGSACDVLLADTTGEMIQFMNISDIVIMGKSLAGHNEGHNVIEPAMLGKPVVTGCELRNFRQVLKSLQDEDAIITVADADALRDELDMLISNPQKRQSLGNRARDAVTKHRGAIQRTIQLCEKLLS